MNSVRVALSELLRQILQKERALLGVQVLLAVIVPAGISYAVNLVTGNDARVVGVGIVFLIFCLLVQTILFLVTVLGPSTPARAAVALHELQDEIEKRNAFTQGMEYQRNSYFASAKCFSESLSVLLAITDSQNHPRSEENLRNDLRRLLEPYIAHKDAVFNFSTTTALYRITVFLHKESQLVPNFYYADPGIDVRNRSWPDNGGHAGQCFQMQKVIITEDLTLLSDYKDTMDEQDNAQYRSMASVPLFNIGTACGVLVVTASEPGQFNYDNTVDIFEGIGRILSLYMRYIEYGENRSNASANRGNRRRP